MSQTPTALALPPFFSRRDVQGSIFALLATAVWSGNFIVGRGLAEAVPPITLATLRWSIAFIAVLPLAFTSVKRDWPHVLQHKWYYIITALFGISTFNTLIYVAGHTVPAINLSLEAVTSPLFTIILARIFFGEAITLTRLLGIFVVVCGVLLLISKGNLELLYGLHFQAGDLIMLLAAFLFAVYNILVRKKPAGASTLTFLVVTFGLGELFLLPLAAWELGAGNVIHWSPTVIFAAAYIGIGASLFSFWCWGLAIERIGAIRASMIYYALPVFCGIEAVLLLGEPVLWVHYVGGALILSGVILATRERK